MGAKFGLNSILESSYFVVVKCSLFRIHHIEMKQVLVNREIGKYLTNFIVLHQRDFIIVGFTVIEIAKIVIDFTKNY